ncbi:MAG: hypothetical protein VYB54_15965 [Pseudomonadota bacterium]|nr:hypothetical protein [Pseudomonadota bacterium]
MRNTDDAFLDNVRGFASHLRAYAAGTMEPEYSDAELSEDAVHMMLDIVEAEPELALDLLEAVDQYRKTRPDAPVWRERAGIMMITLLQKHAAEQPALAAKLTEVHREVVDAWPSEPVLAEHWRSMMVLRILGLLQADAPPPLDLMDDLEREWAGIPETHADALGKVHYYGALSGMFSVFDGERRADAWKAALEVGARWPEDRAIRDMLAGFSDTHREVSRMAEKHIARKEGGVFGRVRRLFGG